MIEPVAHVVARGRDNCRVAGGGRASWRQLAAVACLVLATAGCTSSGDSGRQAAPPSSAADNHRGRQTAASGRGGDSTVVQTSILAEPAPPVDYQLVLPGVAMPVARVLEAHPTGAAEPTNRLFAKWGLVVRAGTALDLQLLPGWEQRARIRWGSSDAPGVAVHAPSCQAPSGTGQWLHFAGGTWGDEARLRTVGRPVPGPCDRRTARHRRPVPSTAQRCPLCHLGRRLGESWLDEQCGPSWLSHAGACGSWTSSPARSRLPGRDHDKLDHLVREKQLLVVLSECDVLETDLDACRDPANGARRQARAGTERHLAGSVAGHAHGCGDFEFGVVGGEPHLLRAAHGRILLHPGVHLAE